LDSERRDGKPVRIDPKHHEIDGGGAEESKAVVPCENYFKEL